MTRHDALTVALLITCVIGVLSLIALYAAI